MLNRDNVKKFKTELAMLLDKYGLSTACKTPDYVLADYVEKSSRTSIQPYLKLWLGMTRRGERCKACCSGG